MKSHFMLSILLFSNVFFSCTNKTTDEADTDSNLIQITKAQFATEKMAFGEPVLSPFSDLVHFTGSVIPKVNGKAQISLPVSGIISKIYGKPGMTTTKGSLLLEVSGNELIDLQQRFAESAALLKRLKSEYERAQELNDENIGTKKEYILAESAYIGEKAKSNALKMKLEQIGLDVNRIK